MKKSCKHENFSIAETAETALVFFVEDGHSVGGNQTAGIIRPVVEFYCSDCGHKVRFNHSTTKRKYLKKAYEKAVYGDWRRKADLVGEEETP